MIFTSEYLVGFFLGYNSSVHEKDPTSHGHDKMMVGSQQNPLFTLVRKEALPVLGLSLFWTWTSLSFYCLLLFPGLSDATEYARDIWIWTSWAQALTFLLVALLSRFVNTLLWRQHSIALLTVTAVVGTALMPTSSLFVTTNLVAALLTGVAGAILMGCIGACIVLMWVEAFCRLGEQSAVLGMNCSLVVSAVFYFAAVVLPYAFAIAVTVVLPIISGILLAIVKGKLSDKPTITVAPEPEKKRPKKFMLPLAVSFFCALLGEVFRSLMTSTPDDTRFQMMGNLYVAGGAIGVVFLSLMLWALKARQPGVGSILPKSEGLAIRTVLLVMIFGFVITALFNTSLFLGYTFFCAAFWCLRALSWMYSVRVAIHKGSSVLIVFGLSLSCFSLPVALSVSIMPQLTSAISNSAIPWASVVMVAITLLFVLTIFILDPKDIGTNWGLTLRTVQVSSLPQDRESALCFLKDEYRLTEREFDVALLLGKGRSLPFIQEELHIAEGTALTHLRHIYQKLGVHNRQEFITVIETAAKSQQESTGDYAEI